MKTLCYVLFVVLSVVAAAEDNFFEEDSTRKVLNKGDAPYVVTIRKQEEYICNGVILTKNLVLTASNCILQDFDSYSVVYGTTIFDSEIRPDEKKQVSALIFLNGSVRSSEKNNGNHSEGNDDNDEDVDKNEDGEDKDYAENRKSYLSKIVVVKVDSPFDFNENVNDNITLPFENEGLSSYEGTIVFRVYENDRSKQSLQSQKITPDNQEIAVDYIILYFTEISKDDKDLLQGSPFVINNKLYGLIVVVDDIDDPKKSFMVMINIPRVIGDIHDIITNNN